MPKHMQNPQHDDEDRYKTMHHVDGNDTSKFPAQPLEIENGNTFWTDSRTGRRTTPPSWHREDD